MSRRRSEPKPLPPCYALVLPGLGPVAAQEIAEDLGGEVKRTERELVVFRVPEIDRSLLRLRTVEDVFALAWGTDQLTYRAEDLERIRRWTARDADWEQLLRVHHAVRPRPKGKPTFRLVTQMTGKHGYRRVDARKALAQGLAGKLPASWRHVDEDAAIEIWLTIQGAMAFCGIRLSDQSLRHRTYKREHLPASLRPTLAAAMVRLADIRPGNTVLDPMCGAGTILAEAIASRRGRVATWEREEGESVGELESESATTFPLSDTHTQSEESESATTFPLSDTHTQSEESDSVEELESENATTFPLSDTHTQSEESDSVEELESENATTFPLSDTHTQSEESDSVEELESENALPHSTLHTPHSTLHTPHSHSLPLPCLLGGDVDSGALRAAIINLRRVGNVALVRWDARRLPLADRSIDRIISNPPFGKQLSRPEEIEPLYRQMVTEYDRVLRPGGRAVLLVSDAPALREAARTTSWKSEQQFRVFVLGQAAVLSVWRKPN